MKIALIYVASVAVCVGLSFGLLVQNGFVLGVGALALGALFFVAWFGCSRTVVLLLTVVCVGATLGLLRVQWLFRIEASETLPQHMQETALVRGVVVEDPDRRETWLRLVLQVAQVQGAPATGQLLVMVPRDSRVEYGDTVVVEGRIDAPKEFLTSTGHTFDYPNYLRAHGIAATMSRGKLGAVEHGGFSVLLPLYRLKHTFEASLERLIVEPDVSLLEGILLGEKHGIPQKLTNTFVESGLVHVVVLSGYNIAVVASGVFSLCLMLPRLVGTGVGAAAMVLFSLMTGAGTATVRALAMALLALVARYLRRPAVALRGLCFAAAVMALWSPRSMLYDTGFILSVLATFGLITLSPWVESWLPRACKKNAVAQEIITSTIAVQLFTLPALLYYSGVLSFVAVPANVLALPVVPLAMFFGFVAGLVGLVSPALGFLPALGADMFLKWILFIADIAAALPFGSVVVQEFPVWVLVLAYAPLTWFAVQKYQAAQLSPLKNIPLHQKSAG